MSRESFPADAESRRSSCRPLEQTADVPHVLESRERRRPEAVKIEQVREFQNRFQGVGSLGLISQKESSPGGRNVRWRLQSERPKRYIGYMAPEVDERPARVVPKLAEITVRP